MKQFVVFTYCVPATAKCFCIQVVGLHLALTAEFMLSVYLKENAAGVRLYPQPGDFLDFKCSKMCFLTACQQTHTGRPQGPQQEHFTAGDMKTVNLSQQVAAGF